MDFPHLAFLLLSISSVLSACVVRSCSPHMKMRRFFGLVWALPVMSVLALDDSSSGTTISAFESNGQQCYIVQQPRTTTTSSSSASVTTTTSDTSSSETSSTSTTSDISSTTTSASSSTSAAAAQTCYTYIGTASDGSGDVLTLYLTSNGQGSCSSSSVYISDIGGNFNELSTLATTTSNDYYFDNCFYPSSETNGGYYVFDYSGLGFQDSEGNLYHFYAGDSAGHMRLDATTASGASYRYYDFFTGTPSQTDCSFSSGSVTTTSTSSSDSSTSTTSDVSSTTTSS